MGKYQDIFLAAHTLFREQGYEVTTVRQISGRAGVSLGMPNHLFGSKTELAGKLLGILFEYSHLYCRKALSGLNDDPLLDNVLHTTVNTLFLLQSGYRRFYIDCLRSDVFFGIINRSSNYSLNRLAAIYGFPVNEDLFTLYGKYFPYHCEKTLVLQKESGEFSGISYREIPAYILSSKFEHFLSPEILKSALEKADALAERVLKDIPDPAPDELLLDYLERQIFWQR